MSLNISKKLRNQMNEEKKKKLEGKQYMKYLDTYMKNPTSTDTTAMTFVDNFKNKYPNDDIICRNKKLIVSTGENCNNSDSLYCNFINDEEQKTTERVLNKYGVKNDKGTCKIVEPSISLDKRVTQLHDDVAYIYEVIDNIYNIFDRDAKRNEHLRRAYEILAKQVGELSKKEPPIVTGKVVGDQPIVMGEVVGGRRRKKMTKKQRLKKRKTKKGKRGKRKTKRGKRKNKKEKKKN